MYRLSFMNLSLYSLLTLLLLLPLAGQEQLLREHDVITSLKTTYPPYLALLMEQDLADAKVRQAIGGFDSTITAKAELRPKNYYDGSNYEAMIERPFEQIGGSLYGGYRYSNGFLPSYKRHLRTGEAGEAVLGFQLPLLRGFRFNDRLAKLSQAKVDQELAKPSIALQYLDMLKAGRLAYYHWMIKGYALMNAQKLLTIAKERQNSFTVEVEQGARPKIILIDNERVLIQRTLAVNEALVAFENATLTLSLFYREGEAHTPVRVSFSQLPSTLPLFPLISDTVRQKDLERALNSHPSLHRLALFKKRTEIDLKLARNNMKPDLSLGAELNQGIDDEPQKDIENTELTALLKFTLPLGQNEARGREEEALAQLTQLQTETRFAREVVQTDIELIHNSLKNDYQAYLLATRHEQLSEQMLEAETKMFDLGASDLLQLQLREQSYLDAQHTTLKNLQTYYTSYATYLALCAKDLTSESFNRN